MNKNTTSSKRPRVYLGIQETFRCPVYRNTVKGLEGPLTRTFRAGEQVAGHKLEEAQGQLHVDLGKGYLAFNIPTSLVYISR